MKNSSAVEYVDINQLLFASIYIAIYIKLRFLMDAVIMIAMIRSLSSQFLFLSLMCLAQSFPR